MYVRFPLSLRKVEDLLSERDIDICYETVRIWWNRFGPLFAREMRRRGSTAYAAFAMAFQSVGKDVLRATVAFL